VSVGRLVGAAGVGGDEVVKDDQEEQEDPHQVAEHGQLNVRNHGERSELKDDLLEETEAGLEAFGVTLQSRIRCS